MTDVAAIKVAFEALHLPASLPRMRAQPLPAHLETVLRIASGDDEVTRQMAEATERSPDLIRRAAVFYIEEVLFAPDATHYRVLGASPQASVSDLRRNMALLMTWLHPDKNPSGDRALLASRVTTAWDTLRSPDRRAAYDAALLQSRTTASIKDGSRTNGHRLRTPKSRSATPQRTSGGSHFVSPAHRALIRLDVTRLDEHRGLLARGWVLLRRMWRSPS